MHTISKTVATCFITAILLAAAIDITSCKKSYITTACPDANTGPYVWREAKGMGNGSFETEWRNGTFPLALMPVLSANNHLWMPGRTAIWESADGLNWQRHEKADWGERISMSYIYFKDTLWMYGGMMYQDRRFVNDIWFSADGKTWAKSPANGEWQPRKGQAVIVFKNKVWLLGGANGVASDLSSTSFLNDIWSSEDGKHWTLEKASAEWSPREHPKIVVLNDTLFMLGGQGYGDVWKSANGKDWTLVTAEAEWKKRYDHGALAYDNKVWVFGGRDEIPANAYNDIWSSEDGLTWENQTRCAPWSKRSAAHSIVFDNKVWLFSGKHTGARDNWGGDIWTMEK